MQIANRSREECSIDTRFLFNILIDGQWYEMPMRALSAEELTQDVWNSSLESLNVYVDEYGGMSQTVSQDYYPNYRPLKAGEEITVDFHIEQKYRKLKCGNYRIGIRQKGDKDYTMEKFQVTV